MKRSNKDRETGSRSNGNKRKGPYTHREPESTQSDELSSSKKESMNDLSWYVVSEQVLKDVARLPYSIPVGMAFNRDPSFQHIPTGSELLISNYDSAIPGVLVSNVMPMLGIAHAADDPVNVAANSIYQFVRSKISGSRTYNAVDFMVYLGAMDSLFCLCTWLTRLYGTMYTFHGANKYLAQTLVESQGFDYDDFRANLTDFRAVFNQMIAKIKSLYVPSNMSIFVRHSWMFANYYIEGMSEKDQIYLHKPAGYYTFGLDSDKAGMLKAHYLPDSGIKVSDIISILDSMIEPIYDDEDFNKISGDLLRAYEGKVFTITEIPDLATVSLQYSEEVLLQFKNAKYISVDRSLDDPNRAWVDNCFDYKQDYNKRYLEVTLTENALNVVTEFNTNSNAGHHVTASSSAADITMLASRYADISKSTILTSPHADVSDGENMINTRLTANLRITPDATSFWSGQIADWAVGTEWPVWYAIFTHRRNKLNQKTDAFARYYQFSMYMDTSDFVTVRTAVTSQLPILSSFKYHPELFMTLIEYDPDQNTYYYRNAGRSLFEVDNYALVDFNVIRGLHNAAILGQYNVPNLSVGK